MSDTTECKLSPENDGTPREQGASVKTGWQEPEGYAALWLWFGLSRASWLTLPRVLMHEMPDQWQADMARLLNEFNETFPNMQPATTIVTATKNKRMVKMPEGAGNYRRPCQNYINSARPLPPEPTP